MTTDVISKISNIIDLFEYHIGCCRGFCGICVLAILVTFQPLDANAQEKNKAVAEESQAKLKTLPPGYNNEMLRLAEIIGALHYLRELCGANEKLLWRDQMANVIESEDPNPKRKAELIGRFNRGFRTYQEIYRECTPAAIEAVNLYLRQGTKLAGEIPGRFGR